MLNNEPIFNEKVEKELEIFIKENSSVWDLTDTKEFLLYNKDAIIEILQRL